MQKEKPIVHYLPLFIRKEQNKGLASSTISKRKKHVEEFGNWLENNNLEHRLPSHLQEKELQNYKKYLARKKRSKATEKEYWKTVCLFLEYLQSKNISCPILQTPKTETDIQKIVNHYFQTKGYSLEEIKKDAKKKKIIYSRYTKPAADLLELAGSVEKAKKAIDKVAAWADSRDLDYAIETVFKKWPELDKLKPKEKKKKPYYRNSPMIWSTAKQKWYVIDKNGDWLEFADDEKKIEWREE